MTSALFTFNLPLQVWPEHANADDETSPVIGHQILNYMARRQHAKMVPLQELLEGEGVTREEYFENAALQFENLARLMRMAKTDVTHTVYYPDEGMPE